MLLIGLAIYIWWKFSQTAEEKGLDKRKWGAYGVAVYIGCGLGIPFFTGVLIGLGFIDLDVEDGAVDIVLSLVCYGIGGIGAYLLYQKLLNMPDAGPDIEEFGKDVK